MCTERSNQYIYAALLFTSAAASLLSAAFCVAAEFKKSKKTDLRLDGKQCYLPGSAAFELGIAAVICLSIGQIAGSCVFICRRFRPAERRRGLKAGKPTVSCGLFVFSWDSFGISIILMIGATSMSRSQPFGEGWLDGECYLVKNGVYIGSAVLTLIAMVSSLGLTLGSRKVKEVVKLYGDNSDHNNNHSNMPLDEGLEGNDTNKVNTYRNE